MLGICYWVNHNALSPEEVWVSILRFCLGYEKQNMLSPIACLSDKYILFYYLIFMQLKVQFEVVI